MAAARILGQLSDTASRTPRGAISAGTPSSKRRRMPRQNEFKKCYEKTCDGMPWGYDPLHRILCRRLCGRCCTESGLKEHCAILLCVTAVIALVMLVAGLSSSLPREPNPTGEAPKSDPTPAPTPHPTNSRLELGFRQGNATSEPAWCVNAAGEDPGWTRTTFCAEREECLRTCIDLGSCRGAAVGYCELPPSDWRTSTWLDSRPSMRARINLCIEEGCNNDRFSPFSFTSSRWAMGNHLQRCILYHSHDDLVYQKSENAKKLPIPGTQHRIHTVHLPVLPLRRYKKLLGAEVDIGANCLANEMRGLFH